MELAGTHALAEHFARLLADAGIRPIEGDEPKLLEHLHITRSIASGDADVAAHVKRMAVEMASCIGSRRVSAQPLAKPVAVSGSVVTAAGIGVRAIVDAFPYGETILRFDVRHE